MLAWVCMRDDVVALCCWMRSWKVVGETSSDVVIYVIKIVQLHCLVTTRPSG